MTRQFNITQWALGIIFTLIALLSFTVLSAQNVKVDKQGNYYQVKDPANTAQATKTGKTYTDANKKIYPVYKSKNNKLFIIKTSKTGTQYKYYLKLG